MTDIALDKMGRMIGISFDTVYEVNKKTADVSPTSRRFASRFNGLSFITPEVADGHEFLVAAAKDGEVFRDQPDTGQASVLGTSATGCPRAATWSRCEVLAPWPR